MNIQAFLLLLLANLYPQRVKSDDFRFGGVSRGKLGRRLGRTVGLFALIFVAIQIGADFMLKFTAVRKRRPFPGIKLSLLAILHTMILINTEFVQESTEVGARVLQGIGDIIYPSIALQYVDVVDARDNHRVSNASATRSIFFETLEPTPAPTTYFPSTSTPTIRRTPTPFSLMTTTPSTPISISPTTQAPTTLSPSTIAPSSRSPTSASPSTAPVLPTLMPSLPPSTQGPTPAPNLRPTFSLPSQSPTFESTLIPTTAKPSTLFPTTDRPTLLPTMSPIIRRTLRPIPQSTDNPTSEPTADPRVAPTLAPTNSPTEAPTNRPSFAPSATRTADPTTSPSLTPTAAPNTAPTAEPTIAPSAAPTVAPTSAPTAVPIDPTRAPAIEPTAQSTTNPTVAPTVEPTVAPTTNPTAVPTLDPSTDPTSVPSVIPTAEPNARPTADPTATPSATPIATPTAVPVVPPTFAPTAAPIVRRTGTPTITPVARPTRARTANPTTAGPTADPTLQPTTAPPTECPTSKPTFAPSLRPTTVKPTERPIARPTVRPTASPTPDPSARPTVRPTASPTPDPSARPTVRPTASPTPDPSAKPTVRPTVSPTQDPSARPSVRPTETPTQDPTSKPSLRPTGSPTTRPTIDPTTRPSAAPTIEPSSEPTSKPTPEPTPRPTRDRFNEPEPTDTQKEFPPSPRPTRFQGTPILTVPTPRPTFASVVIPPSFFTPVIPSITFPSPLSTPVSNPVTTPIVRRRLQKVQEEYRERQLSSNWLHEDSIILASSSRFCGRRAFRASYFFGLFLVIAILFHLMFSPFAKACVVVMMSRRNYDSGLPEESATKKIASHREIFNKAQQNSDAPLLWPRMIWPFIPFLIPAVIYAAINPTWGKSRCWHDHFSLVHWYSQGLVLVLTLLYAIFFYAHIGRFVKTRAVYYPNRALGDRRVPVNWFQPCEVLASISLSIRTGLPLFDEYSMGEWRDSSGVIPFVYSHGAAFEDFLPGYGTFGELSMCLVDIGLAIGVGVAPLVSDKVQLIACLVFELIGFVFVLWTKPFANIALNTMLILERGGECFAVSFIVAEAFMSNGSNLKGFGFWAAVIVEGGILFLTVFIPSITKLLHFTLHSFSYFFKSEENETTDLDRSTSMSETKVSLSSSTFQSICAALFSKNTARETNTSICRNWRIIFCNEIYTLVLWFFLCSYKSNTQAAETRSSGRYSKHAELEEDSPTAESDRPKMIHEFSSFAFDYIAEDSDDEDQVPRIHCTDQDDFDVMTIPELKNVINEQGGSHKDCIEITDLRQRARDLSRDAELHIEVNQEAPQDDETKESSSFAADERKENGIRKDHRADPSSVRYITHQYSV